MADWHARLAGPAFALLAGACSGGDETPAAAYRDGPDRLSVAIGLPGLFGELCTSRRDGEVVRVPDQQCYRFGPPKRMRGVWRDEFEGSKFFPGLSRAPRPATTSDLWLNRQDSVLPAALRASPDGAPRVWLVDFVGRRTRHGGRYGHMGMSRHIVVIDRVITARRLD